MSGVRGHTEYDYERDEPIVKFDDLPCELAASPPKDVLIYIADEDPEAELDTITEEAAEAHGVQRELIDVRFSNRSEPLRRYFATIHEHPAYAYGPTRVEAVKALRDLAQPKLPDPADMTTDEVLAEVDELLRDFEEYRLHSDGSGCVVRPMGIHIGAVQGGLRGVLRVLRERDGMS